MLKKKRWFKQGFRNIFKLELNNYINIKIINNFVFWSSKLLNSKFNLCPFEYLS